MVDDATILIVDDDPDLRELVRTMLHKNGYLVIEAATGAEVSRLMSLHQPHLVLLDLGLPDISGLDLLAELTKIHQVPFIVLSGRDGEMDRVVGLEMGADDYVTKPFGQRELLARVRAALRRSHQHHESVLDFGELVINTTAREVLIDHEVVELTSKEFALLTMLAESPRQVFSRAQLLAGVWHSLPGWQDDRTVAEHVHRLRRKLDPENRDRWIQTVRGAGYRFSPG